MLREDHRLQQPAGLCVGAGGCVCRGHSPVHRHLRIHTAEESVDEPHVLNELFWEFLNSSRTTESTLIYGLIVDEK